MKVTIDGINREEKETQYGMKQRIGLKIVEKEIFDINGTQIQVNDRWLNGMTGLTNNGTESWVKGSVVNIAITEKEGKYLNFKVVNDGTAPVAATPTNNAVIEDIQNRLKAIEQHLGTLVQPEQAVDIDPADDF